ncbi:MAG: hypothetical protein E6J42_06290 [Chloroflexi bacterium]|nr:MAG: hypothetical protein E6J42_06290 [Chloroflexota bacterium]
MWDDIYVRQKLRQLENERPWRPKLVAEPPRRPAAAAIIRRTGRLLREMGEGLESWAAPPACEAEARDWRPHRRTP